MKQAFYIDSDSHLNLELTCQKNHKLKELTNEALNDKTIERCGQG